jgi:hypothetical protein
VSPLFIFPFPFFEDEETFLYAAVMYKHLEAFFSQESALCSKFGIESTAEVLNISMSQ